MGQPRKYLVLILHNTYLPCAYVLAVWLAFVQCVNIMECIFIVNNCKSERVGLIVITKGQTGVKAGGKFDKCIKSN